MSDTDLHERVARVETKQDTILSTLQKHIDAEEGKLDSILSEWSRYKGIVGGIMFTISCIGTAVTMWFKLGGEK